MGGGAPSARDGGEGAGTAMRRVGLVVLTALVALTGACQSATPGSAAPAAAPAAAVGPSWAPAPVRAGGESAVATTSGQTFALHTRGGEVTFVPGINLGSTTPGHYPGELAVQATDYRRWFAQMGALGIRAVRVYTIHRPAFYTELLAYDRAHPDAPLYLVQGVYPPDESYTTSGDLFAAAPTAAFDAETRDAVAAVTGHLQRAPRPGRASGTWTADVSPYVMAWLAGAEMDPTALRDSDRRNAGRPAVRGRYFTSTAGATPTERWLAARLEVLARAVQATGRTAPLAFVNWPTTDPLRHPTEPIEGEDLVGVDANHVQPTSRWAGGYFASYHAYPYYPDFQRYEPAYQRATYAGRHDPYAGYLLALRHHHATMPTLVTEFGVPSSVGAAHAGPLGRDQGDHSEPEAMSTDASLLRELKDLGLGAGFVFEWGDEWFKSTWNTQPRQQPADRKALWHDPWTNEQWFGVLATDAAGRSPVRRVVSSSAGLAVDVAHDPSWLYVTARVPQPGRSLVLGLDVIPEPGEPALLPAGAGANAGSDVAVVADGTGVQVLDRGDQDGRLLDGGRVAADLRLGTWALQRLTTNRVLTMPGTGRRLAAEYLAVGRLREGDWTTGASGRDSLAQYHWSADGRTLSLRLPWSSLLMGDPSSRTALVLHGAQRGVQVVPGITVRAVSGGADASGPYTWDTWTSVEHTERLKDGAGDLAAAYRDTAVTSSAG